jgi:hypothetical protein
MIDNKQLVNFLTFLWYIVEICVLSHIIWSSLIIMFFEQKMTLGKGNFVRML